MTEYLSVSILTKYLKAKFDRDPHLERVYVTGEISNFRKRPRHQYFALKDEGAVISATMWERQFKRLNFNLEDGMKVLVVGRVSLYAPSGTYSINIEQLVPDGVGQLTLQFEQLKKKLMTEGLFDEHHKQSLPQFSKKIAVVTSPSGAVIRDIITTVQRRFPLSKIILYPTKVQGEGAAEEIAANIVRVNKRDDVDLLIIGRGGGSIEDLWCFNEEIVVRAIFESHIPVISSVGHETDTTLADFVADRRAATPTAAAEIATPNTLVDLLDWVDGQQNRARRALVLMIKTKRDCVEKLTNSVIFRQPERLYDGYIQKLSQLTERLSMLTENKITTDKHRYDLLFQHLVPQIRKIFDLKQSKFDRLYQSLLLLDVSKIQARGFAIVTKKDKIVKSVKQVETDDILTIQLKDGEITANAN